MDPLTKISALKYSTADDIKIGANTKYLILDLRTEKKLRFDMLKKIRVIEVNYKISNENLKKLLFQTGIKRYHLVLAVSHMNENAKETTKQKNEKMIFKKVLDMLVDRSYVSILDCGIKE